MCHRFRAKCDMSLYTYIGRASFFLCGTCVLLHNGMIKDNVVLL
jgi:hypothetical protein